MGEENTKNVGEAVPSSHASPLIPSPEPEPEFEAEHHSLEPVSEPKPAPELKPEPILESEPKPPLELEAEHSPKSAPEPVLELEAEHSTKPAPAPEPEPAQESALEHEAPLPDRKPEPELELEPLPDRKPEPELELEPFTELSREHEAEPISEPELEPGAGEPEAEHAPASEHGPEPALKTEPVPAHESESEWQSESECESEAEHAPEPAHEPEPYLAESPIHDFANEKLVIPPSPEEKPDEINALALVEIIQSAETTYPPPSAGKSMSVAAYRDDVLARVESEKTMSIIKAWEESEKVKSENKAIKKMAAILAWENSNKAAVEAELRKILESFETRKAEYAEKMKNKVAAVHREAEERRAVAEAKRCEDIIKAEEMAAKYRATGACPKKRLAWF